MSDKLKEDKLLSITQIQQSPSYVGATEIKGQIDPYLSKIISEACKKNMSNVKKGRFAKKLKATYVVFFDFYFLYL